MDLGTLQRRGRVVGEKAALPSSMSLLFFASVSRGLFCAAAVPCEKERTERKEGRKKKEKVGEARHLRKKRKKHFARD